MPQTMPINDDVGSGSPKNSRAEDYALQKVQITSFIRHILEQYRFGLQILAEFIQNADDAKAQRIEIGLDERSHRAQSVPGEGAAELMGPALTVYNNETFSEQDFQNITNTGDSGKRKDASKTGSRMVAFDPSRRFFPEPLLVEFGPNSHQFADQYPDFCLPFLEYGITFREHYPGTLFRIPLRKNSPPGSLSRQIYSPQELWTELLDEFCEQVAPTLLFLRSVQSISVHSISADGSRKEVCRAEVEAEKSAEFLANRTKIFHQLLAKKGAEKLKVAEFHERLRALRDGAALPEQVHAVHLKAWRCSRLSKKRTVQETTSSWLLSTRVAGGQALQLAIADSDALEDRRIPLVQVAACTELSGTALPRIEGRVHVALPLLDEHFHGMHANLFADTSPDRRKLLRSQERHVTAWSHALMQDGCAASASDMIHRLAAILAPDTPPPAAYSAAEAASASEGRERESESSGSDSDGSWEAVGAKRAGTPGCKREVDYPAWYALFPILDETTQDRLTEVLSKKVYQHLWASSVLMGTGKDGSGLCKPSEAVYVDSVKVPVHVQEVLGQVLRLSGRHWLVQPTERMVRGFRAAGVPLEVVTPHMVVTALHDPTPQLREFLTSTPGAHVACLGYVLRDSKASRLLPGAWAVLSLDGVLRMLPGTRNSISLSSDDNSSDSDGSSARNRADALTVSGELYIASEEQKELIGGASGPLGSLVLAIREDVLHKRLLGRLSRCCGVESLSRCSPAFCKAIPKLLPAHWLDCVSVDLEQELAQNAADGQQPADQWWVSQDRITGLWRHLNTYADLSPQHLNGVGPILPTCCGKLVTVEGSAWFDLADVGFLDADEVQLLVSKGVVLVDCENHSIPRPVRKLKRAAALLVDEVSDTMTSAAGARQTQSATRTKSTEDEDAARVLAILSKLHSRTKLSHEQLEKVRRWPILQVEGADGVRKLVSMRECGSLHDCGAVVDPRLVQGGQFLIPGERSKEMQAVLSAIGVVWVDEPELYQNFLLPSLKTASSMLRNEDVLSDFLAETLPRIESRYGGSSMPNFVQTLSSQQFIPSEEAGAPLLSPVDARDSGDANCRVLFPPSRFPCERLQKREAAMLVLKRMGMRAAASEQDLEQLFPSRWGNKDVVDEWTPGEDGHPSVAQVHAAWVLCSDEQRGSAWAATSAGRLVRGRCCKEMLPLMLPRELPLGFAGRLGLETLLTEGEHNFSKAEPPGGYLPVTPESLLKVLTTGLWARDGQRGLDKLTAEDREFLREFLTRPLQACRVVAHIGSAAESESSSESSALVSVEGKRIAKATTMRRICELAIHREVVWSEAARAVEVQYAAMADSEARRKRRGGERLRGAKEEEEQQKTVDELLDFSVAWVLLREDIWKGKAQLPSGTLGLSSRRFVAFDELSAWFYREIGVQEVSKVSELYAELVLRGKGFTALPPEEQQRHVAFIRERRLLDGSEMGRALALPLRNVTVQEDDEGVLRKASDLVDCRVPELSTIFSSKAGVGKSGPWLLPKAVAKDKGAVAFLEQLGLRKGVEDFDFLVTCARALGRIASAWGKERDADDAAKSGRVKGVSEGQLIDAGLYLFEALAKFRDQDSMLAQVGRVQFIPLFLSKRPYSFQPPNGIPLASVKDLAPPSLSSVHCLVRPTLHPDIEAVPKLVQNQLWPHGELDHDNDTVFTIKQLRRLAELIGDFDNPNPSAEMAPKKHLKELEELVFECYSSLDEVAKKKDDLLNNLSLVHDELVKFPCVYMQTLHTFVRADQVYAAVPTSVSGLLFALDTRLQTWPALISELRIKDRPTRIQWLAMLKSLMDRPPSPQTADSCIELLKIISKDTELMGTLAFLDELVAPDTANTLRPLHELLVNDAPWLLPRIAPSSHINIAHRKLGANRQLARTLRLRVLSEAVEETVDTPAGEGSAIEEAEVGDEAAASRLLRDLKGREVQGEGSPLRHRLLWLIDQQFSEPTLLGAFEEGAGDDVESVRRVDGARISDLLESLPARLVQVDKIVSKFELLQATSVPPTPPSEAGGRQHEQWRKGLQRCDVTNAATRTDSMLLWSRGAEAVHVAKGLLHVPSVMQSKLAHALNKALDNVLNERSERVLSSLLACETKEQMDETMEQLQLHIDDSEQLDEDAPDGEPRRSLARIPNELLVSADTDYSAGAGLCRDARTVLTKDKPEPEAVRPGDLVAVAAEPVSNGKITESLVLAEVVTVYRFLELATVRLGEKQRVVLLGRDVWWYRDVEGDGQVGQGNVSAEKEEESEEEEVEEAREQEPAEKTEEEAGAAEPAEEEDEEDVANKLDAAEKLREIRNEIDSYKSRLEQEKARKLKVYERQVQAEFKDGMKRMLKRLLLKWHPDKLRSQAQEEGAETAGKNAEQMEDYLKDIAQELNRIMQQYSQE